MLTQRQWLAPTPAGCAGVQTAAPFDRGRVPERRRDVPAHQPRALTLPVDAVKDQLTGRGARPENEEDFSAVAARSVSIVRAASREPAWNGLAAQHNCDRQYLKRLMVTET